MLLTRQQIREFKARRGTRGPRPVDVLFDDNIYMLEAERRAWLADPKPDAVPYTAQDGKGQCCIHRETVKVDELILGRGMLGPLMPAEWYCHACADALGIRQTEGLK